MDLHRKINHLSPLITGHVDEALQIELAELEKKLQEEKLYVVVVGLFKRGKSTLINALLQKKILPVGVTPVTALITLIEYAEQASAAIYFKNRKIENISLDKISAYVAEEDNPDNIKQVNYVKIFDNAPVLQFVSLIDTPGLGSAYEHNTQTTLSFIHKIDVALFLLSADYPISKVDIELLKELQQTVPEIWYILTKADLATSTNLQKIIGHNRSVIASELKVPSHTINFTIVSGNNRQDEGIGLLQERLIALAQTEKTKLIQQSSIQQLKRIVQQATLQLQFKADAYLMPLQELENKSRQLASSIQLMNEQKDEFESIISGKIKALQQSIHEAINKESNKLEKAVNERIDSITNLETKALQTFQNEINRIILTHFEEIKTTWEQKTKEHFKILLQQYSQRSRSFFQELTINFSSYFGQNMNIISEQFDLDAYTSFYLSLDSGFPPLQQSQTIFDKLLPISVQNKKLQKKWQQHYKEIIVRNTASVIYDLTYKIQESFRKFNYDLNRKMNALLQSMEKNIEDVISNKAKAEVRDEAVISNLTNCLAQLKSLDWL